MPITFEQLQQLMKGEALQFFIAPDRPMVRFGIRGLFGTYDIVVLIDDEGRFLQFRTVSFEKCPASHPNLLPVLQVLLQCNYLRRFVKFAWDAKDGEIVAYADAWVMDNHVTQEQFHRMMGNYLPTIDTTFHRVRTTLDTGKDPGEPDPLALLQAAPGGGEDLPPELRDLLAKLRKGGDDSAPAGPKSPTEPIREL